MTGATGRTRASPRLAPALALAGLLAIPAGAPAEGDLPSIGFVGPQGERANLRIDRRTELIAPGDTSRDGRLRVLSMTREAVVVRYGGVTWRIARGARRAERLAETVVLERGRSGMFRTAGEINGRPVEFIVDTGASHVVLSASTARALRLRYRAHRPVRIHTASGTDLAYRTTLGSVAVQGIVVRDVPALVTRGRAPRLPLLGMSFLRWLRIEQGPGRMVISR